MQKIKKSKNKIVVAITSNRYHQSNISPIINELKKRGFNVIHLRFYLIVEKINYIRKIMKLGIYSPNTVPTAEIEKKVYYLRRRQDTSELGHEKSTEYKIPNKSLKDKVGKAITYIIFKSSKLFRIRPPDCIVVSEIDTFFEKISIHTAKFLRIPSLFVIHGIVGYGFERREDCVVDKIAVLGRFDRDRLIEGGIDKDKLVITGRPKYDILMEANKIFNREKTFERLNLDKNKKLIVWTTSSHSYTKEENEKLFYGVYKAIKEISDQCQLVIKLHPGEVNITLHRRIAKDVGVKPVIIKNIDTFEILYACDLLLTETSTTGIEALILGKPLVTMHFAGHPDLGGYAESGAALGVYEEKNLIINIRKALYDKETIENLKQAREKFLYERAYLQDGKATERVCDLVEEMIKESKNQK